MSDKKLQEDMLITFAESADVHPSLPVVEELQNIKENINEGFQALLDKETPDKEVQKIEIVNRDGELAAAFFSLLKGKDGEKGETPSDEHLTELIRPLIPEVRDGQDADEQKIIKQVLAKIPVPSNGEDGENGKNGINGENGKDGSPDTGEQIIDKINSDESEKKIKGEKIEGWQDLLEKIKGSAKAFGGGGIRLLANLMDVRITSVSNGQAIVWDSTLNIWKNGTVSGSGGSSYIQETPVGTVNDTNLTFTVSNTPVYLNINGLHYAVGEGPFTSYSAPTITLSTPVGTGGFIRSIYSDGSGTTVTTTAAQTVSGKRITKRVLALSANSAAPSINTDLYDVVHITSQTAAINLSTNLTGTALDGDTLRTSITGTGAVAITMGASFEASTTALPTTTTGTARLDIVSIWNTETSKWRCVSVV